VEHLESLTYLREHFFARIIHSGFEDWKTDLNDALLFNVNSKQDHERWSKSEMQSVPTPEAQMSSPQVTAAPSASPPRIETAKSAPTIESLKVADVRGESMAERVLTLSRMDSDDRGNVKLCLRDEENETDVWMTLSGDEAMKLGAFPGTKVKVTLQKS